MRLEDQVCTLFQAKTLNELGVVQGCSLFFFDWWSENIKFYSSHTDGHYNDAGSRYSAFTVAELSVMLLEYAETYFTKHFKWRIGNEDWDYDTQAEASADRLIYFLENNILTVEEVNNRLTK